MSKPRQDIVRILQAPWDVKHWLENMPTVDQARPARCPGCGAASRPVGAALVLWGHGLRERLCQGPPAPNKKPQPTSVNCRRYQCQACPTVVLVVPRGVARRKHYATTAIAWALALFGVCGLTRQAIRRAISIWPLPNGDVISSWKTLRRWLSELQTGALFAPLGVATGSASAISAREIASRAASALAGRTPWSALDRPIDEQIWLGGAQMV